MFLVCFVMFLIKLFFMLSYLSDPYHLVHQYNELDRKFSYTDFLLINPYQVKIDTDINSPCV
jgi:hypothetical protein